MSRTRPWRRRTQVSETPPEATESGSAGEPAEAVSRTEPAGRTEPAEPAEPVVPPVVAPPGRRPLRHRGPLPLLRAAHPRQALLTAFGLALVAALSDRPTREVALVFATVLVGQAVLGWHNDLVDRDRDRRHDVPGKPIAQGLLDPGNTWFALLCGVLLLIPLAVSTGIAAGSFYLATIVVGMVGNVVLRTGVLSWVPWAVSFALYPWYLSYGGWGGAAVGVPPEPLVVVLFALLGIGVHFLRALWGLVPDNEDGWTYLPLQAGLRLGASRLLTVTCVYLALVLAGLAVAGTYIGLGR